jgi:hypothetical protein
LCLCAQLLENVTRHQLTEHLSDILPPIQGALCDEDAAVREAAGAAFGVLFKGGAHGAVESVVPSLLHGLDSPGHASQSMEGLRVILSVRPQVFNGIVPKLLKQPVSSAGLRAIGQLAGTAGAVDVDAASGLWRMQCTARSASDTICCSALHASTCDCICVAGRVP